MSHLKHEWDQFLLVLPYSFADHEIADLIMDRCWAKLHARMRSKKNLEYFELKFVGFEDWADGYKAVRYSLLPTTGLATNFSHYFSYRARLRGAINRIDLIEINPFLSFIPFRSKAIYSAYP